MRREKTGFPTKKSLIVSNNLYYLVHQGHGGVPIVVQRTLEVRKVVSKASKVDFVTYVKGQGDGNNSCCRVFGFLGKEGKFFFKTPNEIFVPKAYLGGLIL